MRHHDEKETHGLRGVEADRLKIRLHFRSIFGRFSPPRPFQCSPQLPGGRGGGVVVGRRAGSG